MTARDVFTEALRIAASTGAPRGPFIAWVEDRTAVVPSDQDFIELNWTGGQDSGLFRDETFHAASSLLRETLTMVRTARVTLLCKAWNEDAFDLLERVEIAMWGRACSDVLNTGNVAIIDTMPIIDVGPSYPSAKTAATRDFMLRYFIQRSEDVRAEKGYFDKVDPVTGPPAQDVGPIPGVAPGDAR